MKFGGRCASCLYQLALLYPRLNVPVSENVPIKDEILFGWVLAMLLLKLLLKVFLMLADLLLRCFSRFNGSTAVYLTSGK
ncbi:hypothetical protein OH492_28030 [Vibrio chagasii]|nr:hypothetical protein [Vibrio chagasii]